MSYDLYMYATEHSDALIAALHHLGSVEWHLIDEEYYSGFYSIHCDADMSQRIEVTERLRAPPTLRWPHGFSLRWTWEVRGSSADQWLACAIAWSLLSRSSSVIVDPQVEETAQPAGFPGSAFRDATLWAAHAERILRGRSRWRDLRRRGLVDGNDALLLDPALVRSPR